MPEVPVIASARASSPERTDRRGRKDQAFGVMKLSPHPDSFSWDYKPALAGPLATNPTAAMTYSDSGTAKCRG